MNTKSIVKFVNNFSSVKRNYFEINGTCDKGHPFMEDMARTGLVLIFRLGLHEWIENLVYAVNSDVTDTSFLYWQGPSRYRAMSYTRMLAIIDLSHTPGVSVHKGSGIYHNSLIRFTGLEEVNIDYFIMARYDYYVSRISGDRTKIRTLINYDTVNIDTVLDNTFVPCYTLNRMGIGCGLIDHVWGVIHSSELNPIELSNRELAMAESVVSYFVEKLEYYILSGEYTVLCDRKTAIEARSIALSEDGIPIVLYAIGETLLNPVPCIRIMHMCRTSYRSFTNFIDEALPTIASSIYISSKDRDKNKEIINAVSYYNSGLCSINKMKYMYGKFIEHSK